MARPGEAQRAVAQPGRLPAGQHPARRRGVLGSACRQRVGQQDGAQPRHLFGLHGVQRERGVARGLLSRADPQYGQPEQPVQQPGIGRDRPNPVARHRQHLALQHTGAQLHLAGLDSVGGGEPAGDAEPDRQPERAECPHRVVGRRTEHDRTDQQRELAQHLVHRVYQQHPRAQPLPVLGGRTHVASWSPIAAMSVSCATIRSATSVSSATMRTAPADDAVVTVTLARPNSRSSGPR